MGLTLEATLIVALCLSLLPLAVFGAAHLDDQQRRVADEEIRDLCQVPEKMGLYVHQARPGRPDLLSTEPARALRLARFLDAESRRAKRWVLEP